MKLSTKQKLLIAASKIKKDTFTSEELVVNAWENYKLDFGLEGFTDKYPNSNKVYTLLMGRASIIEKENWLEKVGQKKLSLTSEGKQQINKLINLPNSNIKSDGLRYSYKEDAREITLLNQRFLTCYTAQKILNDEDEFSYLDACDFWNIPQICNAQQMNKGLIDTTNILSKLLDKTKNNISYEARNGKKFTHENIKLLKKWHTEFQKEFSEEIETIKKRSDQRKY